MSISFMYRFKKQKIFLGVFVLIINTVFSQTVLRPDVLKTVRSNVFEVVVEKPQEGNIGYEKPLPLDRIPFSIRNDKYIPLGTAFLMKDKQFYSASHVFNLYEDSVYTDYYIRDEKGNVYKVDSISKFATDRDFIVFTVEGFSNIENRGLDWAEEVSLNTEVFSVGNALGDGIVIRNGVYTSATYEDQNGEWKWIRFSAAASPGNSGGPLITNEGKVLGIITMKSENENLNYALPFSEIDSVKENTGVVKNAFFYVLPNVFSERFYHKFEFEVLLPKKFDRLKDELTIEFKDYIKKVINGLRVQFSPGGEKSFSSSQGWQEFFCFPYLTYFPYTVYLTETNKWQFAQPSKISEYALEDNGSVSFGAMMGYYMGTIKKPETLSLVDLIQNPSLYMEYMIKATGLYRTVAGEKIAITSLGDKPYSSDTHVDIFGRTWFVNSWTLPFADSMILSYALPLPEGLYIFYSLNSTAGIFNGTAFDMPFMCDFIYPSYIGSLANWQQFTDFHAQVLKSSDPIFDKFVFDWGKNNLTLYNGEVGLHLPKTLFNSSSDTMLRILTAYFLEDDARVSLKNYTFDLYTNRRSENYRYVFFGKVIKPHDGALKESFSKWNQKLNQVSPFNGLPYNYEGYTYLDKVIYPEGVSLQSKDELTSLYTMSLELDGQNKTEEISSFASEIEEAIIFLEMDN